MQTSEHTPKENDAQVKRIIDVVIRISALGILVYACYRIIEPFVSIMLWGSVLAVSLNPVYHSLTKMLKGRKVIASVILTVLLLSVLIVPIVWMSISAGMSLQTLGEQITSGNLAVPVPDEDVKSFPLVGNALYDFWQLAATNMEGMVSQYKDQLIAVGKVIVGLVGSIGKGILLLAGSIIVSGILLAFGNSLGKFAKQFFVRLVGERGIEMASIAEVTVRTVTRGVLGVAFIQSMLAGIGMFIAGVPLAALWTLFCLLLAIMQVGLLPVSLGVIIYSWTHLSTTAAVLITIWMLFVGVVDNILKPILLGKGAPVPMLVILLGTIGGFIASGFIGLFTGAILLSLGYKLMIGWVQPNEVTATE